jgi:hypothetical protein
MSADRLPTDQGNIDPDDKKAWERLEKDGRADSVLCFGTGNATSRPCEKKQDENAKRQL